MSPLRGGLCLRRWLPVLTLALAIAACGTDDGVEGESTLPADAVADSLSPAQERARRDSAVARSGLPGAEGVSRALDASDAARARAEASDSLLE